MNQGAGILSIFSRLFLGFSGAFLTWQALDQGAHLKTAMAINGIALLLFAASLHRPK